jgi:hypothetical protein
MVWLTLHRRRLHDDDALLAQDSAGNPSRSILIFRLLMTTLFDRYFNVTDALIASDPAICLLLEMAHRSYQRIAWRVVHHFSERQRGKSKMSVGIQAEAAFRVWQVWWYHRDLRRRGALARVN